MRRAVRSAMTRAAEAERAAPGELYDALDRVWVLRVTEEEQNVLEKEGFEVADQMLYQGDRMLLELAGRSENLTESLSEQAERLAQDARWMSREEIADIARLAQKLQDAGRSRCIPALRPGQRIAAKKPPPKRVTAFDFYLL